MFIEMVRVLPLFVLSQGLSLLVCRLDYFLFFS